ncbi:MAG: alpha-amylase family glycosyl hydrolase [Aristaeellaceae bacterium]
MKLNFYIDDYSTISVEGGESLSGKKLRIVRGKESFDHHLVSGHIQLKLPLRHCSGIQVYVGEEKFDAIPRLITHTPEFDRAHPYDIRQLGSFYSKTRTEFYCYAPTHAALFLVLDGKKKIEMVKKKSTFFVSLLGDLEGCRYHYETPQGVCFTDPFAYNATYDGKDSYVLDVSKLRTARIVPPPRKNPMDLCIYETSVRDFSSDPEVGFKHPATFLAFTETGLKINGKSAGVDYLRDLGISHVQLMPVFRFDRNGFDYNWGYNPVSYSTLHPEYGVGRGPYDLPREFRSLVDTLHRNGLRVTLDVVFNHVFSDQKNELGRMLPYYCFRYHPDCRLANGSYCGNELRTEAVFIRDMIVEMCRRYIEIYDIDGLRFDLMGMMDLTTVSAIRDVCRQMKPDFLLYGEGWNMGEVLPAAFRCHHGNADKLPGVAFFNAYFRDAIRGSNSDINCRGYAEDNHAQRNNMKIALAGSYGIGMNPSQSVNYVECHDNLTMYDKLRLSTPSLDKNTLIEKTRMTLALIVLARGIPFIHSGQEFLRSKKMIDNSYNRSDEINQLYWKRRDLYSGLCDSLTALLQLRREHDVFTTETVKPEFVDYYEVLIYRLGEYKVFINPCIFDHLYQDGKRYQVLYDGRRLSKQESKVVEIPHYSVVVVKEAPEQPQLPTITKETQAHNDGKEQAK